MQLYFVTGNEHKYAIAQAKAKARGIKIEQVVLEIDEIQGEDPELIARDKAQKAYDLVGKPVVITDDSWSITALNGFPGAYMKSVNHWFTPQNFIDLLQGAEDRSVILHQYLVYQDDKQTVTFQKDLYGQVSTEARGSSYVPWRRVAIMEFANGKTLAELDSTDELDDNVKDRLDAWEDFFNWAENELS